MYLNDKEEKIIGKFLAEMEYASCKDLYEIEWESGANVFATFFSKYEDDNGLELNDPDYDEFWSVAVEIVKINSSGPETDKIFNNEILEINYHLAPKSWKKIN